MSWVNWENLFLSVELPLDREAKIFCHMHSTDLEAKNSELKVCHTVLQPVALSSLQTKLNLNNSLWKLPCHPVVLCASLSHPEECCPFVVSLCKHGNVRTLRVSAGVWWSPVLVNFKHRKWGEPSALCCLATPMPCPCHFPTWVHRFQETWKGTDVGLAQAGRKRDLSRWMPPPRFCPTAPVRWEIRVTMFLLYSPYSWRKHNKKTNRYSDLFYHALVVFSQPDNSPGIADIW